MLTTRSGIAAVVVAITLVAVAVGATAEVTVACGIPVMVGAGRVVGFCADAWSAEEPNRTNAMLRPRVNKPSRDHRVACMASPSWSLGAIHQQRTRLLRSCYGVHYFTGRPVIGE